jgi:hypothetical protein
MGFAYQVELKFSPTEQPDRLRRIEAWCADWQLGFRVHETLDRTVRVAFEDARYARAFQMHFGGVLVPVNDVDRATGVDAEAQDEYDRLACEYIK